MTDQANTPIDPASKAPELLMALANLVAHETCRCDYLNPCWSGRPTDVPGKHWGGGAACEVCTARALVASLGVKVDVWAIPPADVDPDIIVGCEREPDYDDTELPYGTEDEPDHDGESVRPFFEEAENHCAHRWVYTGTNYGGDDERWMGEGRCYCANCGADGDA